MPIPFRDADEIEALGAAGFLRFLRDASGTAMAGGILLVDGRAEPLELVHHWLALPGGALWSPEEAWRHASRRLAVELFRALGRTPEFLLVRSDDLAAGAWIEDLRVAIPVGTVSERNEARPAVRWLDGGPPSPSFAGRLFERLAGRELLGEPFERAARAIRHFHPDLSEGATG